MRLRYILSLLLAILLAPFFAFWAWSAVEAARLDRMLDALEARHEPLDIAEFERKTLTAEQKQASHLYAQAGKLMDDVSLPALAPAGKTIEALCSTPAGGERERWITELHAIEQRYAMALGLLDRAAALDAAGWDEPDRPKTSDLTQPQRLAAINAVRIARRACGDDPAGASEALLTTLRIGRIPLLTVQRLRTGHGLQSILSVAPSPAATLQAIQQEYEREADDHLVEDALLYLRARWLSVATPGVFSDMPAAFAARRITPLEAIAMRLSRPAREHATVSELREFDEVIEASKLPWPRKLDAPARLRRKYPRVRRTTVANVVNPFPGHFATGQLEFLVPVAAESLARTRASVGAVAVARWRADHAGALPASLHDLVPSYISAPLVDPYTGQEFKYVIGGPERAALQGVGYRVYSVGANRKDDGGKWEQSSDLQWARRGEPLDVGIAVTTLPKSP